MLATCLTGHMHQGIRTLFLPSLCIGVTPSSVGSIGLQPNSDGLQPNSDGLQPNSE